MPVAILALLGLLSGAGLVLLVNGHDLGLLLIVAGIIVVGTFHIWSRRAWARRRANEDRTM